MSLLTEAVIEWRGNTPYSPQFGDIYFSDQDGIAETRYVFLQQNNLPQRWLNKSHFTVLETGFGTGLNFFCTLSEWLTTADDGAQLYYVSVEKFPLALNDLKKLVDLWPEFKELINALVEVYPPAISGYHACQLFDGRVRLLLLWGDAIEQFSTLSLQADACFLDGFAPAKNADMWSPILFNQLARLLKPGASLSTFTAVGDVRRGLQQAGFEMNKTEAFGNKRHMLTGTRLGSKQQSLSKPWFQYPAYTFADKKAVIIGAGIVGISTAVALAQTGWQVTILEQKNEIAGGASGNPAGVVMPRLDKQLSADSEFYWQAFYHTVSRLQQLQRQGMDIDWHACGVLQLIENMNDRQEAWPDSLFTRLDQQQASDYAGLPVTHPAWLLASAGYLSPRKLCQALLDQYQGRITVKLNAKVENLCRLESGWQLELTGATEQSDVVVICNAQAAGQFAQSGHLPVQPVRGQISYLPATDKLSGLKTVVCEQSYIIPAVEEGLVIGASFQRDQDDCSIRQQDHQFNLEQCRQCIELADTITVPQTGRAAVRAVTPDRMPVVGAVTNHQIYSEDYADLSKGRPESAYQMSRYHDGLFINSGHGSRGLTSCFLAADYLISIINNTACPLPVPLTERLHPARFDIRNLIKGKQPYDEEISINKY